MTANDLENIIRAQFWRGYTSNNGKREADELRAELERTARRVAIVQSDDFIAGWWGIVLDNNREWVCDTLPTREEAAAFCSVMGWEVVS
jgi:hypothetical protein